jgi:hypothetical protein
MNIFPLLKKEQKESKKKKKHDVEVLQKYDFFDFLSRGEDW